MTKEKRLIHHSLRMTEAEEAVVREKMEAIGIKNQSMYFRAMALNGYLLKVELPEIRELTRLMSNLTNNVNQIAKRVNEHGSIYETELEEITQRLDGIWSLMSDTLNRIDKLAHKT